ncbi:uncharacterized protein [Gossypium hirsutum]|uniref:Retrotransposon gag domain-containing protein n=1 Tax=Gossypium hirsutum TaxID=3635 RepID=A0ABM2YX88_GOSHI|nr:uncharacterized protein LOC121208007 [Gossypium hirsutum]
MDKRLEKLEQMQKEIQEQMQSQMQEQLAKIQREMKEQMMESQREMMSQLSQLLLGGTDKGKGPMDKVEETNEDPQYPPGFTPTHVLMKPEINLPKPSVTIMPQRMTGYVNNDQLLIHCFQDSLVGAASKWYNQLNRSKINSWKDLAQAFMKQYNHVTDMTPDRITLQDMEKKSNESFRQYAQRWREVAIQFQPPLLEKETTMLFINTLKAPFITHMLGSATKSFSDIVMT